MQQFVDYYTNWWIENYPPLKVAGGFNIYGGSAGRAVMFGRLYYQYSTTGNVNSTYLDLAGEYITTAISLLPTKQYYAAYMSGHVGVWTIKAGVDLLQGNINGFIQYLGLVNKTFENVDKAIKQGLNTSQDGINMTLLDMETGSIGMVHDGTLINSVYDPVLYNDSETIIDPQVIANIAFYVMDVAIETGQSLNTDYLQREFTFLAGCYLYGTNHGPTGLIHTFIRAYLLYPDIMKPLFSNSKYYTALKNTLDFYLTVQLPDGNMPTQIEGIFV